MTLKTNGVSNIQRPALKVSAKAFFRSLIRLPEGTACGFSFGFDLFHTGGGDAGPKPQNQGAVKGKSHTGFLSECDGKAQGIDQGGHQGGVINGGADCHGDNEAD